MKLEQETGKIYIFVHEFFSFICNAKTWFFLSPHCSHCLSQRENSSLKELPFVVCVCQEKHFRKVPHCDEPHWICLRFPWEGSQRKSLSFPINLMLLTIRKIASCLSCSLHKGKSNVTCHLGCASSLNPPFKALASALEGFDESFSVNGPEHFLSSFAPRLPRFASNYHLRLRDGRAQTNMSSWHFLSGLMVTKCLPPW